MNRSLLWIALAAAVGAPAFGFIPAITVPNANAGVSGNDTSGAIPSGISLEFQTVINSGQFSIGPGSIYITGFAWRAAPGTGALNINGTANVYLSTTPKVANNPPGPLLSTTLANNVGQDQTLVFSGGFTMSGAGCAAGPTPCPFANTIAFTTPFQYYPANGSLLIDVKASNLNGNSGQFDVIDCAPANCVTSGAFVTPLGTATGTRNFGGNITLLTFSTIPLTPVPPSILLTLAGLACLGIYMGLRSPKFS